jgi:putative Ca2+/H+ antiporter (TMEM165/GDT1 family)
MFLGAMIGLLMLAVLSIIISISIEGRFSPHTVSWVAFATTGAIIGYLIG